MLLQVSLARQGHQLIKREVRSIRLPSYDGSIGFMANRRPIIGILNPGLIYVQLEDETEHVYATTGGFFEMKQNHLMLLLDNLYSKENSEKAFLGNNISTEGFYLRNTDNFTFKEKLIYVLQMYKKEIE
jgi:F0F1-type ATP synthase epsilon subunit